MTRILPALHEGHAPFHLHQAFSEALDAFEDWLFGQPEPRVEMEGRNVPISAIFGRMRTCYDLMPSRLSDLAIGLVGVDAIVPAEGRHMTYADAAVALRAKSVERIKNSASNLDSEGAPGALRRALA